MSFEAVGSTLSFFVFFFILFLIEDPDLLANDVDPDQTPHDVASDLRLHCLSMTFLQLSRYM